MAKTTRPRTTTPRTPKPTVSAAPEKKNGHSHGDLENAIRSRAYELYEQRGRKDGFAWDDWLQAESEVLAKSQRRTA